MDLSISTWMMLFFILSLSLSLWKIYVFLPNKILEDDDTTQDATQELLKLMQDIVTKNKTKLSASQLFEAIKNDKKFDKKRFWRFNQNKCNNLLQLYYLKHKKHLV